jgi:hypothetical protein
VKETKKEKKEKKEKVCGEKKSEVSEREDH